MRAPSFHRLFPGALVALALCSHTFAARPVLAQDHDHPQPAAAVSPDPKEEQEAGAQESDRQQEARAENARASTTRRAARPAAARRSRDRQVVGAEEIGARTGAATALDLVRTLRPNWLRSRRGEAAVSPVNNAVVVYQNNVRLGGPEVLSQIPAAVVSGLRFYDGFEATTRWGPRHGAGVIAITID